MTEFYDILDVLKSNLLAQPFVNTVTTGGLEDVDLNKQTIFPLSHIIINSAIPKASTIQFNISILAMDIVDESKDKTTDIFVGNDNEQDVLNQQLQVLNRIYQQMRHGDIFSDLVQIEENPSCEPFVDRFENKLAGWTMTFDVEVPNDMTICGGSVPPGAVCLDAIYRNSDNSFNQSIQSGTTFVSEDIRVYVYDQNGGNITTVDAPSNVNVDIVIDNPTCEDANYNLVNSADELIASGTIASGDTADILLPDTQINVYSQGIFQETIVVPTLSATEINITN